MSDTPPQPASRGLLGWLVHNHVAANLLMLLLLGGGLLMLPQVRKEVFPAFDLDVVEVAVAYPGASPEEVEQGVVLAIEEAVRGVDGVKDVIATAAEGRATIRCELLLDADQSRALSDIKSAVDRVTSLPVDAEEPQVRLLTRRENTVSLVVSGDVDAHTLRSLTEQARDRLLDDPRLVQVELRSPPAREIAIEVPQAQLRTHNLTLEQIAQAVRTASVELPAGAVKTAAGEVLVRTAERRDLAHEFGDIVIRAAADGSMLRVRDVANVRDVFQEDGPSGKYNGKPALMVDLFRVGDQSPLDVADALTDFVARESGKLPKGVTYSIWGDFTRSYRSRIDLLLTNAAQGLALVLITLTLFLHARLAFWVTLGIPISFVGSLLLMPSLGMSINMVSLFGFIIVLGMVVDDAIVIGEDAFQRIEAGEEPHAAAIAAVRDMAMPVIFSVLTTIVAFAPLIFVPGISGKFMKNIPMVVIAVLTISVLEALFLLPSHLAHSKFKNQRGVFAALERVQQRVNRGLEWFISRTYRPVLDAALSRRGLTLTTSLAMLIVTMGLVAGGRLKVTFMPQIEGDIIDVIVKLPYDAPRAETEAVVARIEAAAARVAARHGGEARNIVGMFSTVGIGGNHLANVSLEMPPMGVRQIGSDAFRRDWQAEVGELVGVESVSFEATRGPGGGRAIDVELSHGDPVVLAEAAANVARSLATYKGVTDVDDGLARGKAQLDIKLTPLGIAAGLTPQNVGRQLRAAFFGEEAVRQQRGRNEVRVYVRRPRDERASEADVERFLLRTARGEEVPLSLAAEIGRGRAFTEIERRNGRRIVHVAADLDVVQANANQIVQRMSANELPKLTAAYPGLRYDFGAQQRGQAETFGSLKRNYWFVLIAFFGMLAIAFRSYIQPIIVMLAIPLGLIGAFWGHLLMGHNLSLISFMGIVALSGVVVNSSIVLIDGVNTLRRDGKSAREAIVESCERRFRPILLTTATTFFGLVPMLAEKSTQARFLIPMVISLAFGLLFATVLTLIVIPAGYLVLEDLSRSVRRAWNLFIGDAEPWPADDAAE